MTGPAERKRWRIRRPSAALVVALLALFVALSGTAVAAGVVPLAKRALDRRHGQELAEARRPHRGAGRLARAAAQRLLKTAPWTLAAGERPAGLHHGTATRASTWSPAATTIRTATHWPQDTHPSADGLSWVINLQNLSPSDDTAGTLYAVCLR